MKLLGGEWSKGDIIALLGLLAAVLAVPGMPKLFHWDSTPDPKKVSDSARTTQPLSPPPAPQRVQKSADVTSGQVNFGCEQTLSVETPMIQFGKDPRDISAQPSWQNTDNVKAQNQSAQNVEDPTDHHLTGVKAVGTITGRDKQNFGIVQNCPGGGHGMLTLHVTWTEDQ